MVELRRFKFAIFATVLQVIFLILFGVLADYDPSGKPKAEDKAGSVSPVGMYPMFQDVHVMIYIGFGFLMTFLKRYGYSAVSINLLISAFVAQWAIIIRGLIHGNVTGGDKFTIGVGEMLTGDFAAAAVLISFGAVLGKTSPLQLLVMALVEVVLMQVNEYIGLDKLRAEDIGESMYIHAFGAYFGLAVARVLYTEEIEKTRKEGSVYHSDLFSMIGTIFLWLYWPSFNGGAASGDEQHRAFVNTYLSLCSCTVVTFLVSSIVDKRGKFDMVHVQNATLAGGVAVGTTANMPLQPWGALLLGSVAGVLSVIGYKYITPFMASKLKIHDTCGVHNLHGMPGVLAGIAGIVVAGISSFDSWGESLFEIFPGQLPKFNTTEFEQYSMKIPTLESGLGRSAGEQAGYQCAALFVTIIFAVVGGALTGLLLRFIPGLDKLEENSLFDDQDYFIVAEEGFPAEEEYRVNGKHESPDDTNLELLSNKERN